MIQAVETDAELEKALAANVGADSYVRSVSLSPDSSLLVAGTEDKTIKIWDLATRRLRHSLKGHTKDIYSVDCCADGKLIASGSGDKTAKLWDVQTGACVRTFGNEDGPKDGVTSVAVSPDGKYLAAGSLNKIVRVWDCETGQLAETFDGHEDSVYSVSFSPDGTLLATGSLDKTVHHAPSPPCTSCRIFFLRRRGLILLSTAVVCDVSRPPARTLSRCPPRSHNRVCSLSPS